MSFFSTFFPLNQQNTFSREDGEMNLKNLIRLFLSRFHYNENLKKMLLRTSGFYFLHYYKKTEKPSILNPKSEEEQLK